MIPSPFAPTRTFSQKYFSAASASRFPAVTVNSPVSRTIFCTAASMTGTDSRIAS